jgi:hypothetical protein
MARVDYTVPGLIVPVQQPSGMSCWAAMYTMMYSWKNQVSIAIRDAVTQLGQRYVQCFDQNTGLPIEENRNLASAAGMTAEPLQNLTIEGWVRMLQNHGLLWTSYGWQTFDATGLVETRAGRHIIIIYGMVGDGTPNGTTVKYVDPSDGQFHTRPFMEFLSRHETGFTMRPLTNQQLGQFSQIMHY